MITDIVICTGPFSLTSGTRKEQYETRRGNVYRCTPKWSCGETGVDLKENTEVIASEIGMKKEEIPSHSPRGVPLLHGSPSYLTGHCIIMHFPGRRIPCLED